MASCGFSLGGDFRIATPSGYPSSNLRPLTAVYVEFEPLKSRADPFHGEDRPFAVPSDACRIGQVARLRPEASADPRNVPAVRTKDHNHMPQAVENVIYRPDHQ